MPGVPLEFIVTLIAHSSLPSHFAAKLFNWIISRDSRQIRKHKSAYTPTANADFSAHLCSRWCTGGNSSSVLLYASVSVVAYSACYSALQACCNFNLYSSMLCTSATNNTGTCQGDSGGPVSCVSGGTTYLAGIVSWTTNGCAMDSPSGNSYVSAFTDIINAAISNGVPPTPVTCPRQFRFWYWFHIQCASLL